jgi:outer membrane protein assembly factor BamB
MSKLNLLFFLCFVLSACSRSEDNNPSNFTENYQLLWSSESLERVRGGMYYFEDKLTVFAQNDIVVYKANDGKELKRCTGCSQYRLGASTLKTIQADSLLYSVSHSEVQCFNMNTGQLMWAKSANGWVRNHKYINGKYYVLIKNTSSGEVNLKKIDVNEGAEEIIASFPKGGKEIEPTSFFLIENSLYLLTSGYDTLELKPHLVKYSLPSLTVEWVNQFFHLNFVPAVEKSQALFRGEKMVFVTRDALICLNQLTGDEIWSIPLKFSNHAAYLSERNGLIYFLNSENGLNAVDFNTGAFNQPSLFTEGTTYLNSIAEDDKYLVFSLNFKRREVVRYNLDEQYWLSDKFDEVFPTNALIDNICVDPASTRLFMEQNELIRAFSSSQ